MRLFRHEKRKNLSPEDIKALADERFHERQRDNFQREERIIAYVLQCLQKQKFQVNEEGWIVIDLMPYWGIVDLYPLDITLNERRICNELEAHGYPRVNITRMEVRLKP